MAGTEIDDLLKRVADEDEAAFGALYDAVHAKLLGVILSILKNRAGAEEVLQDVFVKVWERAGQYQDVGHRPMTWLITIARNAAIDRLRAIKPTDDLAELDDVLPSADPSPEAAAVAASEARQIANCMDALGVDRRNAIRGAYLRGQTYEELAKQHDVPINTMRTWLRRSLIALRECMAHDG